MSKHHCSGCFKGYPTKEESDQCCPEGILIYYLQFFHKGRFLFQYDVDNCYVKNARVPINFSAQEMRNFAAVLIEQADAIDPPAVGRIKAAEATP
jgi:hypothetical protein